MNIKKPVRIILILTAFALLWVVSIHRVKSGSSDFDTYYYAGKSVLAGEPIYTLHRHAVNASKSPFVYPPFFACVMAGLSLFPLTAAAVIWNTVNALAFLAAFILISRLLMSKCGLREWLSPVNRPWKILVFLLLAGVLIDNLAMAQVNCVVLFLMMFGVDAYFRKRRMTAGFWIGAAAAIKLVPGLFFIYFLIRREWTALTGGLLAFLFCFVFFPLIVAGPSRNLAYHRAWIEETLSDHVTPHTLPFNATQMNSSNQSLHAVIFRLVVDWKFRETAGGPNGRQFVFRTPLRLTDDQAGGLANAAIASVFVLFCFALAWAAKYDISNPGFHTSIALVLTTMILLSPKARSHLFVFLSFPWMLLSKNMFLPGRHRGHSGFALLASGVFYLGQAFQYCKFLGFGTISALILFFHFTMKLFCERGEYDHN